MDRLEIAIHIFILLGVYLVGVGFTNYQVEFRAKKNFFMVNFVASANLVVMAVWVACLIAITYLILTQHIVFG